MVYRPCLTVIAIIFLIISLILPPAALASRQLISTDNTVWLDTDGTNDGVQFDPGGEGAVLIIDDTTNSSVNSNDLVSPGIANETGTPINGNVVSEKSATTAATVYKGIGASGKSLGMLQLVNGGALIVEGGDVYADFIIIDSDSGYDLGALSGFIQTKGDGSDVFSDFLWFAGDGALVLGDDVSETNNATIPVVVNSADSVGTIEFSGASTFTGDIYSYLKLVTVGNGLVVFDGNLQAATTNFAGDNPLQIADGGGMFTSVTTSSANTGTLEFLGTSTMIGDVGPNWAGRIKEYKVSGGTVTQVGNISATTTTINGAAAQLILSDSTTVNTDAFNLTSGTMDIATNTLTLDGGTGIYTQSAGTTLKVSINSSGAGKIDTTSGSDGTSNVDSDSTVDINLTGYVADGVQYTIVDGKTGTGGVTGVPTITSSTSTLVSFTAAQANSNDDLVITASRTTYEMAGVGDGKIVGSAIENAPSTGDMLTVKNELDLLGSVAEVTSALTIIAPVSNSSNVVSSNSALSQFNSMAMNRLSSVLLAKSLGGGAEGDTGLTGIATGNRYSDYFGKRHTEYEIWADGFSVWTDQGIRDGKDGYEATVRGGALGIDMPFGDSDDFRIGTSGGFSVSDIDSTRSGSSTDISSYQGSLYGGLSGESFYINGSLALAFNQYDASRRVIFGGIDRTANASFNGLQYSIYGEMGYLDLFERDLFRRDKFIFMPVASLRYSQLNLDSYTEEGAGALNLMVASESYQSLESGLGARLAFNTDLGGISIIPEIYALWLYEYIGNTVETNSEFVGGGGSFKTEGADPAQHSLNMGIDLSMVLGDPVEVMVGYDLTAKQDYTSHAAIGTVKYKF